MNISRNLIVILLLCILHVHQKFQSNGLIIGGNGKRYLRAVAVLFRHGDRAPTSSFPTDSYFNESYWPMGYGQLTNKGKTRLHILGKWLRERYNGFLPENYFPNDIYVLSSDADRTLSSASLALAGLYPPKNDQIWNEDLPWQPIPVHTKPKKKDQILAMEAKCPKFKSLYKKAKKSDYYENINQKYAGLYELVSSYTGWNVDDVDYFAKLYSNIQCYSSANESWLPPWTDNLDQTVLENLAAQSYARYTFTQKMKRLGDGLFFDYIFSFFDRIVENEADAAKFLMLSGHQDTIISVLNGMEIYDYLVPKFGAALIWELYESDSGDYHFDLLYKRNQTYLDELQLEKCTQPCLYEHFKGHLSEVTVNKTTWDEECLK